MNRLLPLLIFTLLVFQSCRKDKCSKIHHQEISLDTITPISYYPVYPGSWWTYNDSLTISVEDEWKEFDLKSFNENLKCNYLETERVMLPEINGQFFHYDRFFESYNQNYNSEDILFNIENEWQSWQDPEWKYDDDYNGPEYENLNDLKRKRERYLIDNIDTMTVNSILYTDILIIEEQHIYVAATPSGGNVHYLTVLYYYSNNVGIIKEVGTSPEPILEYSLELTDYFVNQ
jgi:hypothetical protein